jgi:tetratricopeptide (TPR) repeat protein
MDEVAAEVSARLRRGESPQVEFYCAAHPDLADEIREIFPVLQLVEGLKAADGLPEEPAGTRTVAGTSPPPRIGPYRILREIGRGGMGVVYEAEAEDGAAAAIDPPHRVAIKCIHPHLLGDPQYVARFLREAEAGRRVHHPGVVAMLDAGTAVADGVETPYLVLELVPGRNLRDLVREAGPLPERLCLHVARRLAEALSAVHAAGLVHRDVKPENVVVTPDERVKLMDLGVAVLEERRERISRTGAFVGSLLYAAPEQVAGGAPRPAWDLHALGLLLAEVATGRHVDPRVEDVQELGSALSSFFRHVVATLLARDPGRRFPSAAALLATLRDGEASSWWRTRSLEAAGNALAEGPGALPFVGRHPERSILDGAWEDARDGVGRTLLLVGDAGIGKTRLVGEWVRETDATARAWRHTVLRHGPGAIAGPAQDRAAALRDLVGPADLEARLADLFGVGDGMGARLLAYLRGRDGERSADPGLVDVAVGELLRRLAAEQPVAVVVEDLHFAGVEGRRRFVTMANAFRRDRILLVGTTRPEPDPGWADELLRLPGFRRVDLRGLDEEACGDLVRAATQVVPSRLDSIHDLAHRSDGNPYFLLELVRTRMRQAADGAPTTTAAARTVPDSLRSLLAARLRRLGAEDRELLQAAACAGFVFDPDLLAAAAGAGPFTTLRRLGRLERETRLLRPEGRRLRFHHHLLQEVLYEEMLPALRAAWHGALGEALEARGGTGGGEAAVDLATHFLEAGRVERAVPHLPRAIDWLETDAHAYERAAVLAERALRFEDQLPPAVRARTLVARSYAPSRTGGDRPGEEGLRRAAELANAAGDAGTEIEAYNALAELADEQGHLPAALDYLARIRKVGMRSGRVAKAAHAIGRAGTLLCKSGRPDEGLRLVEEALALVEDTEEPVIEGRLHSFAAEILLNRGDAGEAERQLQLAGEKARAAGDVTGELVAEGARGKLAFRQGRFADASSHVDRFVEIGRRIGYTRGEAMYLANQALCSYELGDLDRSVTRAEEALRTSRESGTATGTATCLKVRGRLRLATGRLPGAVADAEAGYELARDSESSLLMIDTMLLRAKALALLGRREASRETLAAATALVEQEPTTAARMNVASCRGRLAEHEGSIAAAVSAWSEAAALAREFGRLPARTALPLGRCLLRQGRADEARAPLEQALAWGKASGCVRYAVMAEVYLAAAGFRDPLAARVALEHGEGGLPVPERIEAHFLLHELPGGEGHLARARRWLDVLVGGAPAEDRDAMRTNVDLHRRVMEAWNAR